MKLGTEGWQFGSKLRDHRDKPVKIRYPYFWWNNDKSTRRAMKAAPWQRQLIRMSMLYGAVLGISFISLKNLFRYLGYTFYLQELVILMVAVSMGQIVSMFRYRAMLEWFRDRRLHECMCGTCEYDLNGVRPESDGCTVCPECGAAWKLNPQNYQPPNEPLA